MRADAELARRAHAALVRAMEAPAGERRALVDELCADDALLRMRVHRLLDAVDRSDSFLDEPALSGRRGAGRSAPVPDSVGNYLIVGVLGSGGMATVYEAIQESPRRRVALKVMHRSLMESSASLRFRFETETLARLHHPGIAQIYEAGTAPLGDGEAMPFFAMELVQEAEPITAFARRSGMGLEARLSMFASVCDAVHHGHQHGVIHRDLKPGNVLVDGEGRAKVIDFGVARSADPGAESLTASTDAVRLIGSLQSMSPEQCGGSGDIDIRTDVYSLGVMLYELVCGRAPLDLSGRPLPAALHAIIHEAPARPVVDPVVDPGGRGRSSVRGLEAIVLKAIEKDPDRRYDSAAALARDVRRWLGDQPIEARPGGVVEQFRLFARRNRAVVAAGLAIVASIAVIAAVSAGFAWRLSQEVDRRAEAEARATEERDAARWQAYTAQIAGALSAMKTGEFQQMRTRLASVEHPKRGWEWGFLRGLSDRSVHAWDAHEAMIFDLALRDDGELFATAASDGSVRLWRSEDRALLGEFRSESGARMFGVAFVPGDVPRLVCGDEAGMVWLLELRGSDGRTELREALALEGTVGGVRSVVALGDGRVLAGASGGRARVWTVEWDGEGHARECGAAMTLEDVEVAGGITGVARSTDGALVVTFNDAGDLALRDAGTLEVLHRWGFPGLVNRVCFSEDDALCAAAGEEGIIRVWDVRSGALVSEMDATDGVNTVRSIAISRDNAMIAAGLIHRGFEIYEIESGRLLGSLGGHTDAVSGLAFFPGDELVISASWNGEIRMWNRSEAWTPAGGAPLVGHEYRPLSVAFSPDGGLLASGARDGTLRLWEPIESRAVAVLSEPAIEPGSPLEGRNQIRGVAFSPDGAWIAAACDDRLVRVFDAVTGRVRARLPGNRLWVASVAVDARGRRVASGGQDRIARVWDLDERGVPISENPALEMAGHTSRVNSIAFSPDGSVIATGSRDSTVRVWSAATGEQLHLLDMHRSDVFAVLFSHDGRRLYSGCRDQTIRVWDVATGALLDTLDGHGQYVTCLALSPDETRLAAGSWFGEIVLFDTESSDLIASFRAHESAIRGIAFSPDGRWIASASYDDTVRLFDSAKREDAEAVRREALVRRSEAELLVGSALARHGGDVEEAARELLGGGDRDAETQRWVRVALVQISQRHAGRASGAGGADPRVVSGGGGK